MVFVKSREIPSMELLIRDFGNLFLFFNKKENRRHNHLKAHHYLQEETESKTIMLSTKICFKPEVAKLCQLADQRKREREEFYMHVCMCAWSCEHTCATNRTGLAPV